jgi:NADPH:quinone reductase-like Zn-dependent oxidoreductase
MKAKETALVAISKDIPPEQACLLSCPIGVGLQAVKNIGKVSNNELVMVTGASGGLGVHALQIAKHLGAKTIAVTSSEGKLVSLMELGSDEVVSLEEFDYVEIVRAMTAEKGVNVIIDTVGSPLFPSSMKALAQFGRFILLGDVRAGKTTLDLAEILFQDSAILSSTGTQKSNVQEAEYLVRTGSIKPIIHTTLPLKDALIGLSWMSDRSLFGRVVLLPD